MARDARFGHYQIAHRKRLARCVEPPAGWQLFYAGNNLMPQDGLTRGDALEAVQVGAADATQHGANDQLTVWPELWHVQLAHVDVARAAVQDANTAARHDSGDELRCPHFRERDTAAFGDRGAHRCDQLEAGDAVVDGGGSRRAILACGCYELTYLPDIAGLHQAGINRLVDDQRLPGERWLILDGCPYAVPV